MIRARIAREYDARALDDLLRSLDRTSARSIATEKAQTESATEKTQTGSATEKTQTGIGNTRTGIGIEDARTGIAIGERIARRARIGPDTCLYRALSRYALLQRSGHAPRFVMGVDEHDPADGHAWVELEGVPFLEPSLPRHQKTLEHPPRA